MKAGIALTKYKDVKPGKILSILLKKVGADGCSPWLPRSIDAGTRMNSRGKPGGFPGSRQGRLARDAHRRAARVIASNAIHRSGKLRKPVESDGNGLVPEPVEQGTEMMVWDDPAEERLGSCFGNRSM